MHCAKAAGYGRKIVGDGRKSAPQSGGGDGNSKTSVDTVLVAGEEAVGRQLRLRNKEREEYILGELTEFRPTTGQHRFTSKDGIQEWITLGDCIYEWASPISGSQPNPTFEKFPGNTEAIGWKVKVYWNEMGRWYIGYVKHYDHVSGLHHVKFCDGDERYYHVRNEPILWIHGAGGNSASHRGSCGANGTGGHNKKNGKCKWGPNYRGTQPEGSESCSPSGCNSSRMDVDENVRSTSMTSHPSKDGGGSGASTSHRQHHVLDVKHTWHMELRPRKTPLSSNHSPYCEKVMERSLGRRILHSSIGVYWSRDKTHYRATIKAYDEESEKFRLAYDDNQEDDVDLAKESFKWLGPKGNTAGYHASMREVMLFLEAKNVRKLDRNRPITSPTDFALLNTPNDCIGRRLYLYWDGTQEYYEAEILCYDSKKRMHFVWYRDGELEWLDLKKEILYWGESSRTVREFPAGLKEDEDIPRGKAAVGWRISVFWKDDMKFYDGRIMKYDRSTGRHEVTYDDGETEKLSLSSEKVIWKLSPTTGNTQLVDSDNERVSATAPPQQTTNMTTSSTRKIARGGAAANPKQKQQKLISSSSPHQAENLETFPTSSVLPVDSATSSSELARDNKPLSDKTVPRSSVPLTGTPTTTTSSVESDSNGAIIKTEERGEHFTSTPFSSPSLTPDHHSQSHQHHHHFLQSQYPGMSVAVGTSSAAHTTTTTMTMTCHEMEAQIVDDTSPNMKRMNEELMATTITTEEEDLELFPILKIPKEPLPPVDQTRIARLPPKFGGNVYQLKITAGKSPVKVGEDFMDEDYEMKMRGKSEIDQMLEYVREHQNTTGRIGHVPLRVDFHSCVKVMPVDGDVSMDYPSKEMSQQKSTAVRHSLDTHRGFYHLPKNACLNHHRPRGKAGRKGRPSGGRKKSLSCLPMYASLSNKVQSLLADGGAGLRNLSHKNDSPLLSTGSLKFEDRSVDEEGVIDKRTVTLLPPEMTSNGVSTSIHVCPKGINPVIWSKTDSCSGLIPGVPISSIRSQGYPGLARNPDTGLAATIPIGASTAVETKKFQDTGLGGPFDLRSLGLDYSQNMINPVEQHATTISSNRMSGNVRTVLPAVTSDGSCLLSHEANMESLSSLVKVTSGDSGSPLESSEKLSISKPSNIVAKPNTMNMTIS